MKGRRGAQVHRTTVRSSAPWHFPISQGCLRYLCSAGNEVIQDGEALSSQCAGRPLGPSEHGLREIGEVVQREKERGSPCPSLPLAPPEGGQPLGPGWHKVEPASLLPCLSLTFPGMSVTNHLPSLEAGESTALNLCTSCSSPHHTSQTQHLGFTPLSWLGPSILGWPCHLGFARHLGLPHLPVVSWL